jgi:hypothetical protein
MHQFSLSVNDFDPANGFFDRRTQKDQFHADSLVFWVAKMISPTARLMGGT